MPVLRGRAHHRTHMGLSQPPHETMKLTYPSMPRAGTIIGRDGAKDLRSRFLMVLRESDGSKLLGPYTVDIVTADSDLVYQLAQGGEPPRSIVEHYIVRRRWTPYGFARIWGSTPSLRPETIAINQQIAALKTAPRPMSPAKARRKALERIRQDYRNRINGASEAWKRSKQHDTTDNAHL